MAGDADTGDLLMAVYPTMGQAITGQSSSQLTPPSPLLAGFYPGKVFEISNFKFSVQALKEDETQKAIRDSLSGRAEQNPQLNALAKVFAANKPASTGEAQSCPVQPVSFERPIDSASATLLQLCINCKTLYGAVVVKRKPAGGIAAGETYLRMEFIGILITNITMTNSDPVMENTTFISRAVNVKYRPQLPDGSLGAIVNGFWSRMANRGEILVV